MKVTVWLATRDRWTWIAAAEAFGLAVVLFAGPSTVLRVLIGLPLLAHLGYSAMTSVPVGTIPGRPAGQRERRNQELRSRVVGFLNEVRRVEEYAQQARTAGLPRQEVEQNLRAAQERMMVAAAQVAKVTGRTSRTPSRESEMAGLGSERILVHQRPVQVPTQAR